MATEIDLRQFDEVLSTARSVRRKLDFERPLERQVLFDCIDVAVQAPTGIAGEAWRFVVVDEQAQKAEIASLYKGVLLDLLHDRGMPMKPTHQALIDRLHEIPAMIFVCVDGEPMNETVSGHVAYYGSILPAAWSLMLALRARGIGATWDYFVVFEAGGSCRGVEYAERNPANGDAAGGLHQRSGAQTCCASTGE